MGRGKVYPAKYANQLRNPLRRLLQSPPKVVANLRLAGDMRVLELGCGPGFFSEEIARRLPHGRLHLFDFQREMLELAQCHLGDRYRANCTAVQGDGMALPYRAESFDRVLLVTVLGEVSDPIACLSEVRRVLRAGGEVAISEGRNDSDFHPPETVIEMAEEAGLRLVRRTGPRWNYTAVFAR